MLSVPRKRLAMYSIVRFVVITPPGCGPKGFALDMTPFPFATRRRLPSGVTRTDVGYQPTGMKPSERLLPGVLTSKTATTLMFALATNNVRSEERRVGKECRSR